MKRLIRTGLKWLVLGALGGVAAILVVRMVGALDAPALMPWHTHVPEELGPQALDAADWPAYLAAEQRVLDSVRTQVSERLPPEAQVATNRYHPGSPVFPGRFAQDWNRSYVMEPDGQPRGVAVLLHGLTDAPYSLRHIARRYRELGYVAIGLRLPGHGTVPGALTEVGWEEWQAATRLAVREARKRVPAPAPLHLVGYSNGGALALNHALDAIEDPSLARADRLILLTPMIGVTRFARFAGLAGLPAMLPPFANAAWLGVVPEFNPFKYNSFPVNAARQSYRVTQGLQTKIERLGRSNKLGELPPMLTFQSVVDATVSAPALLQSLYAHVPDNGSEVVFFDVNRSLRYSPMLRPGAHVAVDALAPKSPQPYRFTVIGNAEPGDLAIVERSIAPGAAQAEVRALALTYPRDIFSLSHISIPMPMDDSLYGLTPTDAASPEFGFNLGTLSARGERGVLLVDQDFLNRLSSNPFFPYLMERVEEEILRPSGASGRKLGVSREMQGPPTSVAPAPMPMQSEARNTPDVGP